MDGLLENPLLPAGAGGLIALLAGFGLYRARQRKNAAQVDSSFLESKLQPDSFFGSSGGQMVNTKDSPATNSSSMVYSPSQLDAAGDVDPVAEADVYLAYGRDLQAEEILKEALRGNPSRVAIHGKLLEIYAKRRDTKAFEVVAVQAYNLTSGEGPEWEQISDRGRHLDPTNPLYQPGGRPAVTMPASPDRASPNFAPSTVPQSAQPEYGPSSSVPIDLDLDLDFADDGTKATSDKSAADAAAPGALLDMEVDVDISKPAPLPDAPASKFPGAPALPDLPDLNLPLRTSDAVVASFNEATAPPPPPPPAALDSGLIEFDLGALSVDPNAQAYEDASTKQPLDADDDPLSTKLALAQEFHAIGDVEGARALVQEVVAGATGSLKMRAERFLSELS